MTPPERPAALGPDLGRSAYWQRQPVTLPPRPRRGRKIFRAVLRAALLTATSGFTLPLFASYRSVWASVQAMTWPHSCSSRAAAAASMASCWLLIRSVLPALRLRESAVVNLGAAEVAHPRPAGLPGHGSQLGDAVQLGYQHA
jgi:hypothetical protein